MNDVDVWNTQAVDDSGIMSAPDPYPEVKEHVGVVEQFQGSFTEVSSDILRGPEPMETIQQMMNAAGTQIESEAPTAPTLAPDTQSESQSPPKEDKVVKKDETFTAETRIESKSPTKEEKVVKKDETFDLNPDFPETEINLLDTAFTTDVFKNPDMHLYFETKLRKAVDTMMTNDPLFGLLQIPLMCIKAFELCTTWFSVFKSTLSFIKYNWIMLAVTLLPVFAQRLSRIFMMGWKRSRSMLRIFSWLLPRIRKQNVSIRLSFPCNIIQIISSLVSATRWTRCLKHLRNYVSAWHLRHTNPWRVNCLRVRSTLELKALRGLGRLVVLAAVQRFTLMRT
jgi:hypothetical protein